MSRFSRFLNQATKLKPASSQLVMDLGSTQTRILLGKKLVRNQPSLMVWDSNKEAVLSLGNQALHWQGKDLSEIQLVQPVRQAVLTDLTHAQAYLKALIKKLDLGQLQAILGLNATLGLPASISPVETKQLKRVFHQAGGRWLKMKPKLEALTKLPNLQRINQAHCIIDFGGDTVELGLFLGSKVILTKTLVRQGGEEYTEAIKELVKTKYQCLISQQVAAKIKHQVGFLPRAELTKTSQPEDFDQAKITIRGKSLLDGSIKTIRVSSQDFAVALDQLAQGLVREIKMIFGQTAPELVSQALQQGIFLTGGGSQLNGLQAYLAREFGCPVVVSEQPELDVLQALATSDKGSLAR